MRKYRDKNWLEEQYLEKERSCESLAIECGCSRQTIFHWLRRFKVPTRTQKESVSSTLKERLTLEEWANMSLEVDEEIKRLADILDLPSELEAERNRLAAHGKARKAELNKLKEQMEREKRAII